MQRRLLEAFDAAAIHVESDGNVFAAVNFLHGIALEEVPCEKLLAHDPACPVVVTARAYKT